MNVISSFGKKNHNKTQFDFYKCKKDWRYDRFSEITIHSMPHGLLLAKVFKKRGSQCAIVAR